MARGASCWISRSTATWNLITLKPSGRLSASDFVRLTELVDGYIGQSNTSPNILIIADNFPYWDSFKALSAHVKFVRDHHRLVKKIAIVGDGPVESVLPSIGDHIVKATVKHFAGDQLDEARSWFTADNAD